MTGSGLEVTTVCRSLSVSRSGFHAWRREVEGPQTRRDRELRPLIREIFWQHRRRYGARRIARELHARQQPYSVARVSRLLQEQGLRAIQPRTTQSRHRLGYSPNLLDGRAAAAEPDKVWVGDITYIRLGEQSFGYLSLLLDLYSRRIVGWEFSESMEEGLGLATPREAIVSRQPGSGLIHHTDRGGQYAGKQYRAVLRHVPAAEERGLQVLRIDQSHQLQVLRRLGNRLVVQPGTVNIPQRALPPHTQCRMIPVDPAQTPLTARRQLFLSHSSSTFSRPICSYNSPAAGSLLCAGFDPADSNTCSAPDSSSSFFHSVTWFGWTRNCFAISLTGRRPLTATFALNPASNRRRFRGIMHLLMTPRYPHPHPQASTLTTGPKTGGHFSERQHEAGSYV